MERDELKNQLMENVAQVTFTKVNGEQRVMTCTLLPEYLPAVDKSDPLTQRKIREINPEVMSVWDINAQGWRSFRVANVTDFQVVEQQ
jgi:hypothetical protein